MGETFRSYLKVSSRKRSSSNGKIKKGVAV
jgi:hypothetical protein